MATRAEEARRRQASRRTEHPHPRGKAAEAQMHRRDDLSFVVNVAAIFAVGYALGRLKVG